MVDAIQASGVQVIGDLDTLAAVPTPRPGADDTGAGRAAALRAWPDIVAAAGIGALLTAGEPRRAGEGSGAWPDATSARQAGAPTDRVADPVGTASGVISTPALFNTTRMRLRDAARGRIRGVVRRVRRARSIVRAS